MPRLPARLEPWTRDLAGDAADGERRAELVLGQINSGTDSETLLRSLLNCTAEDGYVIPPSARMRAFCRRLQQDIANRQTAGSEPAVCVSTTSTAEEANAPEILLPPTAD